MSIKLPRSVTPYPDREALQDTFRNILTMAEQSGWTRTEASEALRELSLAHSIMEEATLEGALAAIKAQRVKH